METRELLRYLEKLEIGLSSFSYEELGIVEAGELKKSFEIFRSGLEEKVFGVDEISQLKNMYDEMGIVAPSQKDENPINKHNNKQEGTKQLFSLIESLEKTNLDTNQHIITQELKAIAKNMLQKSKPKSHINKLCPEENLVKESNFTSPKIDLKPALEECMGQMELLEEAIKCYKRNIFEFIGSMKVQMDGQDLHKIPVCCQKLLPSLKMMRATDLMHIVLQIETTSKTDRDMRYLGFLYTQFLAEFSSVDKIVDRELNALKTM